MDLTSPSNSISLEAGEHQGSPSPRPHGLRRCSAYSGDHHDPPAAMRSSSFTTNWRDSTAGLQRPFPGHLIDAFLSLQPIAPDSPDSPLDSTRNSVNAVISLGRVSASTLPPPPCITFSAEEVVRDVETQIQIPATPDDKVRTCTADCASFLALC